jgi:hypothetical protein
MFQQYHAVSQLMSLTHLYRAGCVTGLQQGEPSCHRIRPKWLKETTPSVAMNWTGEMILPGLSQNMVYLIVGNINVTTAYYRMCGKRVGFDNHFPWPS